MPKFYKGDRVKFSAKGIEHLQLAPIPELARKGRSKYPTWAGIQGEVAATPRNGSPSVLVVWDGQTTEQRYGLALIELVFPAKS